MNPNDIDRRGEVPNCPAIYCKIDEARLPDIVALTRTDEETQVILQEAEKLPPPIDSLTVTISGSEEDIFGIVADIRFLPSEDGNQREEQVFKALAADGQATVLDMEGYQFLFTSPPGYDYILEYDPFEQSLSISSAGRAGDNEVLNLAQRKNNSLRHGLDDPHEALEDYMDFASDVLEVYYGYYGASGFDVILTLAPMPEEEPAVETAKRAALLPERLDEQSKLKGFEALGGLHEAKAQLQDVIMLIRHPEILERWGENEGPGGVLMYGEHGTGKTELAKALAEEASAEIRQITSAEIYDMYVGNSAKNLAGLFDEIEKTTEPLVVLFDELDGVIGAGGNERVDASVISLFKQRLGGLAKRPNVLVVATTNHQDALDPAMMRAGRFDLKIPFSLPGESDRAEIFAIIMQQYWKKSIERTPFDIFDMDFPSLSKACGEDVMSGADIREVLRRLVAARSIAEARTGEVPPPVTMEMTLTTINRYRQEMHSGS